MSRLAEEGILVSDVVAPFSDYFQRKQQQEQQKEQQHEQQKEQQHEQQQEQQQEQRYEQENRPSDIKPPRRFGSSTIYKALYQKHRTLNRTTMRLILEATTTMESLGLSAPESVASLRTRPPEYRTLNSRALVIEESLAKLTSQVRSIQGRIRQRRQAQERMRRRNESGVVLTYVGSTAGEIPADSTVDGIHDGLTIIKTSISYPNEKTPVVKKADVDPVIKRSPDDPIIKPSPIKPAIQAPPINSIIQNPPIDPSQPPPPLPLRKIPLKTHYTPTSLIHRHTILTISLTRLAKFTKSLLARILSSRTLLPHPHRHPHTHTPHTRLGPRAQRKLWRGLGIQDTNSATILAGLVASSRRARTATRTRTRTIRTPARRVPARPATRIRRYVSRPSPTVWYPRRRRDRVRVWEGGKRVGRVYVGRGGGRRGREKKRKGDREEARRSAAVELEELARAWLGG
ncbi:hypothetical protein NX059_001228 [Plenodomus lindquistii]|nr:hypothetical protein NX059_001228 [Plenodomus lindquistii]